MMLYRSTSTSFVYTGRFKDKVQDMLSETLKILIQKCKKQKKQIKVFFKKWPQKMHF